MPAGKLLQVLQPKLDHGRVVHMFKKLGGAFSMLCL